jgi:NAD(P)-dependent dehydrogenase (short-subunit alcohol dehydrogenase family)
MQANLHGKTALVTGASRGLGRVIAETFWEKGANLILIARNIQSLQEFERAHVGTSQKVTVLAADLSSSSQVSQLIEKIAEKEIDILVNNAAITGPIGPLWENDWELWNATIQLNLLTPATLSRAIIPHMIRKNAGKIINLSGGGATQSRPNFSAYAVAKTGLVRLTEILAEETKDFNIGVNAIAPGMMKTDMLVDILKAGKNTAGEKEYLSAEQKITSIDGMTKNPAELCLFLADSMSDGITGKLISAAWDPWQTLPAHVDTLKNTDIYTLRRIIPQDRGHNFG